MSGPKRSRKKLWIILAAVVAVAVIVVGTFAVLMYLAVTPPAPPSGPNVTIWNGSFCTNSGNCGYSPTVRNVTSGTTVTWTNNGSTHTVTTCDSSHYSSQACPAPDAAGLDSFDSGPVPAGGSFSHTFVAKGTYYYYCTLHVWMRGQIIVN